MSSHLKLFNQDGFNFFKFLNFIAMFHTGVVKNQELANFICGVIRVNYGGP